MTTIGNHIDFGATKTMIYYRPEAERVAREVGRTVFPEAELTPSLKLHQGTDIKVLLGADLMENAQFMARLNDECRQPQLPPPRLPPLTNSWPPRPWRNHLPPATRNLWKRASPRPGRGSSPYHPSPTK